MTKRRIPLSTLLFLQVGGLLLLVTIILGGLAYTYNTRTVAQVSEERMRDITLRVQTVTNMHLSQMISTLAMTQHGVTNMLRTQREFNEQNGLYSELLPVVQSSDVVPYIYVGTKDGEFYGVEQLADGKIQRKVQLQGQPVRTTYVDTLPNMFSTDGKPDERPYDTRTRPWYKAAEQSRKPVWTPIYTSFSRKTLSLTLSVPLESTSGGLIGALGADYDLVRLSQFMRKLPLTGGGAAFLIEPNGNVLATSTTENPFAGEKGEKRVTLEQLKDPALRAAAQVAAQQVKRVPVRESLIVQTQLDGKTYDVSLARLDASGGQQWFAGVAIARDDLTLIIKQPAMLWVIVGILTLLALVGLTMSATSGLRREIRTLSRFSDRMAAEEDFEAGNTIAGLAQSGQDDELGELARKMQDAAVRSRAKLREQANARKQAQLRSAEFETVVEQSADATAIFDAQGDILFANPAFWQLTGIPTPQDDELPKLNLFERMQTNLEHAGGGGFATQAVRVFVHTRPDGERYMAECLVFPIELPDRQDQHFGLIERDVTERYVAQRQLLTASTRDPLTGLLNRNATLDQLISMVEGLTKVEPGTAQVGVLFLDLNNFKQINDQHGHGAGDRVLTQIVRQVRSVLPADAQFGRWGGDEFLVLLPSFDPDTSEDLISAIRKACELNFTEQDSVIHVSAAIGTSIAPNDGYIPQKLIQLADTRMYAEKTFLKRTNSAT